MPIPTIYVTNGKPPSGGKKEPDKPVEAPVADKNKAKSK